MFEYIVYWSIVKMFIGLDLPAPKYDQYHRDTVNYQPYLIEVNSIDTTHESERFKSSKTAWAFLNEGIKKAAAEEKKKGGKPVSYWSDPGKMINFRIDSIKIK